LSETQLLVQVLVRKMCISPTRHLMFAAQPPTEPSLRRELP
jgi:hypothetical protein